MFVCMCVYVIMCTRDIKEECSASLISEEVVLRQMSFFVAFGQCCPELLGFSWSPREIDGWLTRVLGACPCLI